jgi:hypothetical protein
VRVASILGVALGGVAYFVTLLDYRLDLLRGATGFRYAEQFFDIQAGSIMNGHLWVPEGSLGIEGFVVDGRTYSYFGIFPALLRIPVRLITHEFDGRLSLISMAIAWVVFAVMTTRLYWLVRRVLREGHPVGRLEAALAAIFLAAATGGTSITFDAALPWVYHEVYVWSIASVVGSLYWLLRVLIFSAPRDTRWLLVFVLVASLTRTTGGWAVCLVTIAAGIWLFARRSDKPSPRVWGGVLLAGVLPFVAGIAINYLKFKHPFMFPLENQVFTSVNRHRQEVLAENGGTLAGLQFFPSSLVNYFRPDGIRFTGYFPWVSFPATPARGYGAELDQGYRTGSVPSFMPMLFLLTVASIPILFRRLPTFGHRAVRLIWVGALLMTGGVMAYGYIAYRYTSEFVPLLIIGGMVSVHAAAGWLTRARRGVQVGVVMGAALLTVYSMTIHLAVGHVATATTYKGHKLEAYLDRQLDISGSSDAYAGLVHRSDSLPTGGEADDLWIRGNCDALYFNGGGDDRIPWTLVQERDTTLLVRIGPNAAVGSHDLLQHSSDEHRRVSLWIQPDRQAEIVIHDEGGLKRGQSFDLPPHAQVRVGVRNLSEFGAAEISSTPGGFVAHLPTSQWNDDDEPVLSTVVPALDPDIPGDDVTITIARALPLDLCHDIAAAAGIDVSPRS